MRAFQNGRQILWVRKTGSIQVKLSDTYAIDGAIINTGERYSVSQSGAPDGKFSARLSIKGTVQSLTGRVRLARPACRVTAEMADVALSPTQGQSGALFAVGMPDE